MIAHIKPAPTLKLANGVLIPQLGLGTWPIDDAEAARVVPQALELGDPSGVQFVRALLHMRSFPYVTERPHGPDGFAARPVCCSGQTFEQADIDDYVIAMDAYSFLPQ